MKRWEVIRDGESTNRFVTAPDQETALQKAVELLGALDLIAEYVWVEEATG